MMDVENLKEKFEEKHGSFNFKIIDHYDFWLLSGKTLKNIEDACRERFSDLGHLYRHPEIMEKYFGKDALKYILFSEENTKRKLYFDLLVKEKKISRNDKMYLEKAIECLRFFRIAKYGKTEESRLFTFDIDDYEEKYRLLRERDTLFKFMAERNV